MQDVLALYEKAGGLLRGHFVLSSGLHSDHYFQSALPLSNFHVAEYLAGELASLIRTRPDVVVAPAMGGVIIGHEVARVFGCPFYFMERSKSSFVLRRGFEISPEQKVLIVEDVVTTGRSISELVPSIPGIVTGKCCIVDRTGGAVPELISLIQHPFEAFLPEECLLCQQGVPVHKPGSREFVREFECNALCFTSVKYFEKYQVYLPKISLKIGETLRFTCGGESVDRIVCGITDIGNKMAVDLFDGKRRQ